MKQHVASAGRVGAGVGSNDSVEAEDRLDRVAVEPLLEKVAGRTAEDLDEIPLASNSKPAQTAGDPRSFKQFSQDRRQVASRRHVGRRLEGDGPQDVGHALEPYVVGVEALGVAGGELGDLGFCSPRRRLEIATVRKGQEVGQRPLHHPQALPREIEILDGRRMEQRNRIGGDGIAESGMKFVRRRRAADDRAALDHRDLQSRRRKIGGRDETVVAAAGDNDVAHAFSQRVRHRKPLLGERDVISWRCWP